MTKPRVLLADDHRIVAEGLRSLLEPEFDLVGVVEDGRALVDAARALNPDVIVADIGMPRLNGIDALTEIRKTDPHARAVFLTMHRDVAYAQQALAAGAYGFVLKHSAPAELVLAVRAALDGRKFITPALAGEVLDAIARGASGSRDIASTLTQRQRAILDELAQGRSAKEIGAKLGISPRTVEFHKYKMMELFGAANAIELVRVAIKRGIVDR